MGNGKRGMRSAELPGLTGHLIRPAATFSPSDAEKGIDPEGVGIHRR